jgi:hypothetical protein
MQNRGAIRTVAIIVALVAVGASGCFALDLGTQAWLSNLGFATDRAATDTTFPGTKYFWGLSLYGTQSITDTIDFETGFYSDAVLRNISYTLFSYNQKVLSVGVGPFFGFFNDTKTLLKSGISTAIKLELPGLLFVSFRSDSSIGGELVQAGDYLQQRNNISFGFYVPNAICTLSLNDRSFEQKTAADTIIDSLTEYSFTTNIFQKNVPYRLIVSLAFQALSRSYVIAATTSTLNSVVIGTEVDASLSKSTLLQVGFDGSVYSFGLGNLVGSDPSFLFHAFAGVKVSVDSVPFISNRL